MSLVNVTWDFVVSCEVAHAGNARTTAAASANIPIRPMACWNFAFAIACSFRFFDACNFGEFLTAYSLESISKLCTTSGHPREIKCCQWQRSSHSTRRARHLKLRLEARRGGKY